MADLSSKARNIKYEPETLWYKNSNEPIKDYQRVMPRTQESK